MGIGPGRTQMRWVCQKLSIILPQLMAIVIGRLIINNYMDFRGSAIFGPLRVPFSWIHP